MIEACPRTLPPGWSLSAGLRLISENSCSQASKPQSRSKASGRSIPTNRCLGQRPVRYHITGPTGTDPLLDAISARPCTHETPHQKSILGQRHIMTRHTAAADCLARSPLRSAAPLTAPSEPARRAPRQDRRRPVTPLSNRHRRPNFSTQTDKLKRIELSQGWTRASPNPCCWRRAVLPLF
jgi:hypothetical protein